MNLNAMQAQFQNKISDIRNQLPLLEVKVPTASEFKKLAQTQVSQKATSIKLSPQLRQMREQFSTALDLTSANLEPIQRFVFQRLPGMSRIGECHCTDTLSREKNKPNGRQLYENQVAQTALNYHKTGSTPHVVSIGSGLLGQEVHILNLLSAQQIPRIKLELISKEYANTAQTKREHRANASEMITAISSGLGFNIEMSQSVSANCSDFHSGFKSALALLQPKNAQAPTIELSLFATTDDYASHMQTLKQKMKKNRPKPNMIIDSDLETGKQKRNDIVNKVIDLSQNNAHYISLGKYGDHDKVILETRQRLNGNWQKPQIQKLQS